MTRLKVYLRLKPVSSGETNISEIQNDTTVIIDPRIGNQKPSNLSRKAIRYTFKKIFEPGCSQQDIFRRVALPSVRDVLSGKPALIFINGAAGSGKTRTVIGTPEDAGILPRTLDVLFNSIPRDQQAMKFVFKPDKLNGYDVRLTEDAMIDRQNVLLESGSRIGFKRTPGEEKGSDETKQSSWGRRDRWAWEQTKVSNDIPDDCKVTVFVQFVEIYNNCVYDLLDEEAPNAQDANRGQPWKNIRHDASKCTYVFGATEVEVEDADEAMEVFLRGQARKRASHTQMNVGSFGSHSVYTIKLVQAPINEVTGELVQEKDFISVTQFSLVDLAGSDRAAADSSLDYSSMCLRSCLNTLRENQLNGSNTKVPYRDSRLTHLFKNFFDGIGSIKILLCVNPISEDYAKTLEVMKFSETAEEIEIERDQINRKLTFVDLSPAPSVEDLYTTAFDMASMQRKPETEEESLNLSNLRIGDTVFDATIEDKDTVSFSSAEALHDELQNVISRAAAQEVKYRRKSEILEETMARLDQVQREKNYFKKRLIEVEAQKQSIESQLMNAEESLREVRRQKLQIKKEVERLSAKGKKKRSSSGKRSSKDGFVKNVNEATETISPDCFEDNTEEIIGTGDTSSNLPPERPRRRKQLCRTTEKLETDHSYDAEGAVISSSPESGSLVLDARDDSTDEEDLPSDNFVLKKQKETDNSNQTHVGVMETKERCKIAIEGHPYVRNLVFRKKGRNSFKLKDFFANSKK